MTRFILAAAAMLAVAACSTFETADQLDVEDRPHGAEASHSPFNWQPQEFAGLTAARMIYPQNDTDPVVVEMLSGKEAEGAKVTFTTPDGTVVDYDASGLRAFEGQLARADVEKALATELSDMWEGLAPEIRGGIVDTVCAAFGACI